MMKQLIILTTFFITITINAQAPCEYSSNVTDSTGTYKATKVFDEWKFLVGIRAIFLTA
jgi:hypothetical protein